MFNDCLLMILSYLVIQMATINARETSLQCWRCETTIQSAEEPLVFLDDCQAQFDFTQHRLEDCDGKCWKSADLALSGNSTGNRFFQRSRNLTLLKASRRCFSSDELIRAAELGINTSSGCRKIKQNDRYVKEVCFCSDQDLCNAGKVRFVEKMFLFVCFFSIFSVGFRKNE